MEFDVLREQVERIIRTPSKACVMCDWCSGNNLATYAEVVFDSATGDPIGIVAVCEHCWRNAENLDHHCLFRCSNCRQLFRGDVARFCQVCSEESVHAAIMSARQQMESLKLDLPGYQPLPGIAGMKQGEKTLDWLYHKQLKVDDQWSVRRGRSFTWWADKNAQEVGVL